MLTNAKIKQILLEKGVTHLYHANTVATASVFFENDGLLSRGVVEDRGLFQTPQESDDNDKRVDVFYDIFFDSVDIHQRIKDLNYYGPVLFVYSIDLLDALPIGSVRITKDNPIRWNPLMGENDKYFLSEEELYSCFIRGNFGQHITIRHQTVPLSFDYLEQVVIDDPGISYTLAFEAASSHLFELMKEHTNGIPLVVRQCEPTCQCKEQYGRKQSGYVHYRYTIR